MWDRGMRGLYGLSGRDCLNGREMGIGMSGMNRRG